MSAKKKKNFSNDGGLSANPFEDIASELGFRDKKGNPQKEKSGAAEKFVSEGKKLDFASFQKVVLQRSKKGRGGKTVTFATVSPELDESNLQEFCRILKKQIGCGAWIEDGSAVLQGEVSDRVAQFLEKKGVRKIVRGN